MMRRIALIVLAIATLLLSTGTTIAGDGNDDKPGWGFGAGGHSGPPGQGCPCDVVGPPP